METSIQLDQYLAPYRRDVLRFFRYAVLLVTALASVFFLVTELSEEQGVYVIILLSTGLLLAFLSFLIRERLVALQAGLGTAAFLVMATLLMMSFGPVYSVGVMYFSFIAWWVFFHNNIWVPVVLVVLSMSGVLFLMVNGVTPTWLVNASTLQLIGLSFLPLLPMVAGAFLLHRMLSGLLNSILGESEARQRELNLQREKELIDKALMQRFRLESLGRLSSGVAHDFNNVLTVLMSCLEVLRVVNDKTTREGILNDMEAAVMSAEATSRQLLSLAAAGHGSREPADPRSSLRTLIANLKRLFPENIQIEEYIRGVRRVALERGVFEQMVLNLCINARDSMPEGGTIIISCYEEPADDMVIIEIGDTGSGMSRDVLAQAMDPFFTTKVEIGGTGLGLSQVYSVIQKVGGDIHIDSEVAQGTNVRLMLPLAEPGVKEQVLASVPDSKVGDERRVLLLDDDELVSATMSRALQSAGYEVTAASSVSEAMQRIGNNRFDLLIADRGLPDGAPGRVVARFQKLSDGPVLLISGYVSDEPLQEGVSFLQKPFSPSTLLHRIDEIVTHGALQ